MKETVKLIFKLFTTKEKKQIMYLFFIMIIVALLEMLSVSLVVPIMLAILKNKEIDVPTLFILLIIVFIIKNLFLIYEQSVHQYFVAGCRKNIQQKLLKSFLKRPYEYYLKTTTGEIYRILNNDSYACFTTLNSFLQLSVDLIVGIALFVSVLIIDPVLSLTFLVLLLMELGVIALFLDPKAKKLSAANMKSVARSNNLRNQIFRGIKEIKITPESENFIKRYSDEIEISTDIVAKYNVCHYIPRSFIEVATMTGLIIYLLIQLYSGKELLTMVPQLSAFCLAAIRLLPSFNRITSARNTLIYNQKNLIAVLNQLEYLNSCTDVCLKELSFNKDITIRNVTYRYPETNKKILDNVDFTIQKGQFIGIVGPSGAGKTTFVDVLLGLLKPESGQIYIDDKEYDLKKPDWYLKVGYIPQDIFLSSDTLKENIAFGIAKEDIDEKRVYEVLKEADLYDFVMSLEKGIETPAGELGNRLSGGQRQRISIARALYRDPDLLVLDEATSSLDSETEKNIMEAIGLLHNKKTLIVIAHRLSTIRDCDELYRIENGKVALINKEEYLN